MQYFKKDFFVFAFALRIVFSQEGTESSFQFNPSNQKYSATLQAIQNYQAGALSEYQLCSLVLNGQTNCSNTHIKRLESCQGQQSSCKKLVGLQYGRAPAL